MVLNKKMKAYSDHIRKALASMRCGEIRKSYKSDKKVMQKVCDNGKGKIIHAGDAKYRNNYDPQKKASFRARHDCDHAKPGTPKHLACQALWPKGKHNKWDKKK